MNKELINNLEKLALSPNEATVYYALIDIGQTSAGAIIKKTGFHRNVVYEALNKLIEKKLAFKVIRKGISYFQPTNPDRLIETATEQLETAQSLVPLLKKMATAGLPEIIVYEGVESYRRFWIDSVRKLPIGSIDYVAGSDITHFRQYMGRTINQYFEAQIKRKIKWKMIVFDKEQTEPTHKNNPELNEMRYIKSDIPKGGNFNVFNDDTLILHSVAEPLIIEIKNKSLARVFRGIFDLLWELGKPM